MRVWQQGYVVYEDHPLLKAANLAHYKNIAPHVTVDIHGATPGTYPSNYPLTHIQYYYLASLHKEQFVRAALQAEAEGYDAFFIGSISDAGFEEIRTLVDIPVVAYFQASMLFAATLGSPVGVVSFVPEVMEPQLKRFSALYGVPDLLGPVVPLSIPFDDVVEGFTDPTKVIDAFHKGARVAIEKGANVLIAGEGPLSIQLATAGVGDIDGVPLVDSFGVGLAFCEMRSRFHKLTGLTPRKDGFYYGTPPAEVVAATRERYFGSS
jgi:allantoin racemase